MKKLLLPLVLLLLGTGGGIGTGLLLAPQGAAKDGAPAVGTGGEGHGHAQDDGPDEVPGAPPDGGQTEFVRLNNQFVVPVVARDRIAAMVVLSLSVEVAQGGVDRAALERLHGHLEALAPARDRLRLRLPPLALAVELRPALALGPALLGGRVGQGDQVDRLLEDGARDHRVHKGLALALLRLRRLRIGGRLRLGSRLLLEQTRLGSLPPGFLLVAGWSEAADNLLRIGAGLGCDLVR